ncbi:MAG: tetratricopeptide repeat protein, partial [Planctomycetes bacterium]|nr:tetratricopeptide repeat protein [Planctomycetota bacterium]
NALDEVLAPRSAQAWSLRAEALWALGQRGTADAAAAAALELAPDDARLYLLRARIQVERGDLPRALASYSEAIACGADPQAELERARVRAQSGDRETAAIDLKHVLVRNPSLREGWALWLELCVDDPEAHRDVLDRALRALPDDPEFLRARAARLLDLRAFRPALDDLERLRALGSPRAEDALLRSTARSGLEDLPGALVEAEQAVGLAPRSGDAWRALGKVLLELLRLEEARHALTHALALDPANLYSRSALAQACGALGDHAWAATLIESALRERTPLSCGPYLILGNAYRSLERMADAERAYSKALEFEFVGSGEVRGKRGLVRLELERDAEALEDLQAALKETPQNPALWSGLGAAYSNLGRLSDGLAALERAVELGLEVDELMHRNFALLYLRLERWEEARTHLRAVAALQPGDVPTLCELARVCRRLGDHAEGLAAAQRALQSSPESLSAAKLVASFQVALGELEAALTTLDAALELHPQEHELRVMQIDFLCRADQEARAAPLMDAYLERVPDDARTLVNRAAYRFNTDDLDGAEADLNRALALDPTIALARFNRAMLHIRRDRFVAALEDAAVVVHHHPRDFDAWHLYAEVLGFLGRRQEAAATCEFLLQQQPEHPHAHYVRESLEKLRR